MGLGKLNTHMEKKWILSPITPYTKISFKQNTGLIGLLLEINIGKYLCDFRVGKNISWTQVGITQKVLAMKGKIFKLD